MDKHLITTALLASLLFLPTTIVDAKEKEKEDTAKQEKADHHERAKKAYKKALEAALASEKLEAKHKYDVSFTMADLHWVSRDHTDYKNGSLIVGFTSHGNNGGGEAVRVDQLGEDPVAFNKGAVRMRLVSKKADSQTLRDCETKSATALKSGRKVQIKITALPKFSVFITPREFLYAYARDLMAERILRWLSDFDNRQRNRKRLDRGTKALSEIAEQVVIRRGLTVNVDSYAVSCEILN